MRWGNYDGSISMCLGTDRIIWLTFNDSGVMNPYFPMLNKKFPTKGK